MKRISLVQRVTWKPLSTLNQILNKNLSKDDEVSQFSRKQNASDKINLQHIMELRELFEAADTDKGGALEIEEFTEAFGGVLGKGMNDKQLKQLFMKIDADSNGSVGKHEVIDR